MPRKDEPRIQVRFATDEMEILRTLADQQNVSVGGLIREAAMRGIGEASRAVRRGEVEIRRQKAVEAVRGQVRPASMILRASPEAVERQQRLNAMAERARRR